MKAPAGIEKKLFQLIRQSLAVMALILTVSGAAAIPVGTFGIPTFDWSSFFVHLGYTLPALGALLLVMIARSSAMRLASVFGLGLALLVAWQMHYPSIRVECEGVFVIFLVLFYLIMPVAIIVTFVVAVLALCQEFRHNPAPGFCNKCGYNLKGLPEPRCPECGTPFDRKASPNEPKPQT